MLSELWDMLSSKIGILAFVYVIVLVMVALDLWSGVRKAKQRGEYRSSDGYKRTIKKLGQYYNTILAITATDVLQMGALWHYNSTNGANFPLFPFLTAIGAAFVCFVEIRSICESADKKTKGEYQEAAKMLNEVLKSTDKAAMLSALLSLMSENEKQDKDEQRTSQ